MLGLLGPNGAGKTTAVRILATLLEPDGGRRHVAGFDVVADPQGVRRRIGLAGQYAAVDENLTGRENLAWSAGSTACRKADARERARELLERFDLTDAGDRPVEDLLRRHAPPARPGRRPRRRPPVLFLDEPTTGLDPAAASRLWDIIRDLVARAPRCCSRRSTWKRPTGWPTTSW